MQNHLWKISVNLKDPAGASILMTSALPGGTFLNTKAPIAKMKNTKDLVNAHNKAITERNEYYLRQAHILAVEAAKVAAAEYSQNGGEA